MIDQLSQQITPDTAGILWFSDRLERGEIFDYLNYLVDGLLEKSQVWQSKSDKNLFISSNFDHPLYLGIVKSEGTTEAREILSLIPNRENHNKIILLSPHGEVEKKLRKHFPEITFEKITSQTESSS